MELLHTITDAVVLGFIGKEIYKFIQAHQQLKKDCLALQQNLKTIGTDLSLIIGQELASVTITKELLKYGDNKYFKVNWTPNSPFHVTITLK